MSDVVKRAKALLLGTTIGPWTHLYPDQCCQKSCIEMPHPEMGLHNVAAFADARFIAEARSLVPELIAEIERLRAEAENAYSEGWWQGRDDTEEAGGV